MTFNEITFYFQCVNKNARSVSFNVKRVNVFTSATLVTASLIVLTIVTRIPRNASIKVSVNQIQLPFHTPRFHTTSTGLKLCVAQHEKQVRKKSAETNKTKIASETEIKSYDFLHSFFFTVSKITFFFAHIIINHRCV